MIEFIKFGMAVTVNGTNLVSANSKEHNIEQASDFVFTVASKRAPDKITNIALTNVAEWREAPLAEVKPIAKAKPKTNS